MTERLLSPVSGDQEKPAPAKAPGRAGRLARRWRRFRRRPMAMAGLVMVGLFLILAIVGPLVTGDPAAQDYAATLAPPSGAHPLGTDDLGRDTLARIAYGARTSLEAGSSPPCWRWRSACRSVWWPASTARSSTRW